MNPANAMNCHQCRINLEFALANFDAAGNIVQFDQKPQVAQEFKPSKPRYFLWLTSAFTLGTLIGLALAYLMLGHIPSSWWGGVIGAAIIPLFRAFVTFRNYAVVITSDAISGPSVSGWSKVSFKLTRIDKRKTKRQGWGGKIEGSRYVHSIDGERTLLSGLVFDKNQINTILEKIGCGK